MRKLSVGWLLIAVITVSSCNKKSDIPPNINVPTNFLAYSIKGWNLPVNISSSNRSVTITFPDSVNNAVNLIANFTVPDNCIATINGVKQISGSSRNNFDAILNYTITAGSSSSNWQIISKNNDYTYSWGLGNFLAKNKSNDRNYSWYIDQKNTGFDAVDNCGPTAVTMACLWADSTFLKTPEDARKAYVSNGGWWYTSDIDMYLSDNHIAHSSIVLGSNYINTAQILQKQVDLHQLIILCLDMDLVRYTDNPYYHIDKFYSTTPNFGHFLIIKGYKVVDDNIFFDVYDPNSWGNVGPDRILRGQDRYYRAEDISNATKNWWPYAFVIAKKGTAVVNGFINSNKNFPVQYGR